MKSHHLKAHRLELGLLMREQKLVDRLATAPTSEHKAIEDAIFRLWQYWMLPGDRRPLTPLEPRAEVGP